MEWISIEDRLPDSYGWFLVWDDFLQGKDKITMGFYENKPSGLWLPLDERRYHNSMIVTHWMPLPKQPLDNSNKQDQTK